MKQKASSQIKASPAQVRQQRRFKLNALYGRWKKRRPDPIKELKKMRQEWD